MKKEEKTKKNESPGQYKKGKTRLGEQSWLHNVVETVFFGAVLGGYHATLPSKCVTSVEELRRKTKVQLA